MTVSGMNMVSYWHMSNAQGDGIHDMVRYNESRSGQSTLPIRNSLAKRGRARGDMEQDRPQLCIIVHHSRARQETELRGQIPCHLYSRQSAFSPDMSVCITLKTQQALRF
jgi:hypothetical protein